MAASYSVPSMVSHEQPFSLFLHFSVGCVLACSSLLGFAKSELFLYYIIIMFKHLFSVSYNWFSLVSISLFMFYTEDSVSFFVLESHHPNKLLYVWRIATGSHNSR